MAPEQSLCDHSPAVRTRKWQEDVAGVAVDFLLSEYSNGALLVLTHTGTMGTLMRVSVQEAEGAGPTHTVATLLGKRDSDEHELLARQLSATLRSFGLLKPLLLGVGMRNLDATMMRALVAAVARQFQPG